jgi:hypothetical protein
MAKLHKAESIHAACLAWLDGDASDLAIFVEDIFNLLQEHKTSAAQLLHEMNSASCSGVVASA